MKLRKNYVYILHSGPGGQFLGAFSSFEKAEQRAHEISQRLDPEMPLWAENRAKDWRGITRWKIEQWEVDSDPIPNL